MVIKLHRTKSREMQPEKHTLIGTPVSLEIATTLFNSINKIIEKDGLNPENLIYIVSNAMDVVGKYKNLSGHKKKEVIIFLINDIINNSDLDNDAKILLNVYMHTIVPGAIDIMVDISHGKYNFKRGSKIYAWLKKSLSCVKCVC
jgi:hypothetical protein